MKDFAHDFGMKALECRNDFEAVDRGRFVVVHHVQISEIASKWSRQKMGNYKKRQSIGRRQRATEKSRRNLACNHIPWVCANAPNLKHR